MENIQDNTLAEPVSSTTVVFIGDDGSVDTAALLQHNKAAIIAALRESCISFVVASYSGNGDEGRHTGINLTPDMPDVLVSDVVCKEVKSYFAKELNTWVTSVVDVTKNLEEAIEQFTDDLIEFNGHQGYHNDEGGGGDVTIDVANNTVEHDHYDNVVETISSSHSL